MSRMIATVFYVGLLRPAPGTWGSAAALPLLWLLHIAGGFALVVVATVAVAALGWWAIRRESVEGGDPDPSEFVVDEVVGQWLALWPVSFGAGMIGADVLALWPGWIAAFVLFRLFDILKPGPVGWADRQHGPTGVMLDDMIAGVLAAIVASALAALAHGVLM
ncbi:phosphatidylglycerophosphatase A [Tranquillimonas rosea]|uniref:Phosphatidylglycerophosphatase A n=1 Tax=Tranquillimonas rosea TaxID=641238 RepID=A0A1H9P7C8_9RHOB|nr:phosphatidylglycerophosphatase A [Tranquillimonas rosea]SER43991.1 phosphatidylglycerophosphatase A [Tranquillimonas rosea]